VLFTRAIVVGLQSILSFDENIWCIFNYKCWTRTVLCMFHLIFVPPSLVLCLDEEKRKLDGKNFCLAVT